MGVTPSCDTLDMAFGQASGPPATGKQLQTLLDLLNDAGHIDFRDARGPMGFNQKQAGGRFTRDEAEAFIEQLEVAAELGTTIDATDDEGPAAKLPPGDPALASFTDQQLAAEMQRRGWVVMQP